MSLQTDPTRCGYGDCQNPATTALRFRGQPGHVHDCDPCAAEQREWHDVIESAPIPPCPYPHGDDAIWSAFAPDLPDPDTRRTP